MRIGVTIHATDKSMSPVELAKEADDRGFYSLYVPEHTHIPTSRRTPAPSGCRSSAAIDSCAVRDTVQAAPTTTTW